jgi:hypothetical protein
MFIGLLVFCSSIFLVLLQGWFASRDNFLTVPQMVWQKGFKQGLPFLYHGGMWADVFLISPLLAYMVGRYGYTWNMASVSWVFAFGLVASVVMHLGVYLRLPHPEAHAYSGELTPAGWIHLPYMAACFTVIALFYLKTSGLTSREVWITTGLLIIHIIVGTHVPLKLWAWNARLEGYRADWYPVQPVIDLPTAMTVGGVALLLVLASFYALR